MIIYAPAESNFRAARGIFLLNRKKYVMDIEMDLLCQSYTREMRNVIKQAAEQKYLMMHGNNWPYR